jgi:hypothetical protein
LLYHREIAIDQSENAKADHPEAKERHCRLLASSHRRPTLLKGQIHVNQKVLPPNSGWSANRTFATTFDEHGKRGFEKPQAGKAQLRLTMGKF